MNDIGYLINHRYAFKTYDDVGSFVPTPSGSILKTLYTLYSLIISKITFTIGTDISIYAGNQARWDRIYC